MRKYYIDNIRSLAILLLFPFHTCMIYNGFESFYIHGQVVDGCNNFVVLTYIWFMPLLFIISGISSTYALKKRTGQLYIKERVKKLLVPFISGLLLIVPTQTYYAEKFHNNYQGGYFKQYIMFFTKVTDLTGYEGGFTPGHLWFILFLFVISIIAVPIMLWINKKKFNILILFKNPYKTALLFVVPFICSYILDIAGKSLGQFLTLFILGYLIAKEDEVIKAIEDSRITYLLIAIVSTIGIYLIYRKVGWLTGINLSGIAFNGLYNLSMWVSILAILGYGRKYLFFSNNLTSYMTKASFPIYIFHQTWLIIIAYYVFLLTDIMIIQFLAIMILSLLLSIFTYEVFKRIGVTRYLFGIKK